MDTYTIIEQDKYGIELNLDTIPRYAIDHVVELIDNYYPLYATEDGDKLVEGVFVNIHIPYNYDVLVMMTNTATGEVIEVDLIAEADLKAVVRQARIVEALS